MNDQHPSGVVFFPPGGSGEPRGGGGGLAERGTGDVRGRVSPKTREKPPSDFGPPADPSRLRME